MSKDVNAAIEKLEEWVAFEVDDKSLPSLSYVLVDRDRALASGHFQRTGQAQRLTDRSRFRIASLSKMFTALCLMQLAERGEVDIDTDIARYVPGFAPVNPFAGREPGPFGPEITLRKLMSHTSGLAREPKSGHYLDDRNPSLEATANEMAVTTLKEDPSRGVFRYSNAGIAVVGSVVERVAAMPFADYLAAHIFEPLGMGDSAIALTPAICETLAPAWMWDVDGDYPAPVFDLGGGPAGAICSTPEDMARFAAFLLRGGFAADGTRLISPATLRQMWTVIGARPEGYGGGHKGYGLGFGIDELDGWLSVGHSGAIYGYATQMTLLPEAGLGILLFSTVDSTNQINSRLAGHGLRLALAARAMGREVPPSPQRPPDVLPEKLAALPGHYRSDDGKETVEIRLRDGALYLMADISPLQIRPRSATGFVIDGRLYGAGADYPHMEVAFPEGRTMRWKDKAWTQLDGPPDETPDPELAPHLGDYGPDFNVTTLFWRDGGLKCLIEYFYTHACEPMAPGHYRMHGGLYEDDILEIGATDDEGRSGIRVGPMFLARRS